MKIVMILLVINVVVWSVQAKDIQVHVDGKQSNKSEHVKDLGDVSNVIKSTSLVSQWQQISDIKQFKVSVPAEWSRYSQAFGLSPEEKGVFEVMVFGPESEDGIRSEISIAYYAPGNLIHKSAEIYIKRHEQPIDSLSPAEQYSKIKKEKIGEHSAWIFDSQRNELLPPNTFNPKYIQVYEHYVVISAKEGFFVLHYHTGLDHKEEIKKIFETVLDSFYPKID